MIHHRKEVRVKRFTCEHPLILTGIILVAVNDHYLKQSGLAGVLTGKLSDFAGLFFFPFLLIDLLSLLRPAWHSSGAIFGLAAFSTGLGFVALKCSLTALQIYRNFYAIFGLQVSVVQDPTDLYALIVLPLAVSFHRHLRGRLHATP
jgi:low temperature requirement protein LtrA